MIKRRHPFFFNRGRRFFNLIKQIIKRFIHPTSYPIFLAIFFIFSLSPLVCLYSFIIVSSSNGVPCFIFFVLLSFSYKDFKFSRPGTSNSNSLDQASKAPALAASVLSADGRFPKR